MRIHRWLLSTALAACIPFAVAQSSSGPFSITHSTIDPAAPAMKGGAYSLSATVGQPSTAALGAGNYQLTGGFDAVGNGDDIFRNGFEP